MVCVRCGVWYPPGTQRCPEDNTPLVGPEAVTELAELAELAEDTAVELGVGADDRICACCGERFPGDTRRCPDDGTPLLLPDTLVELLEPSRKHAPGPASGVELRSSRPSGALRGEAAELTCVRCGRVFSGQVRRCPFDFTPLVQRALSSEQALPPGDPVAKISRRADDKTPLVTIVSDSTDEIPMPGGVSTPDEPTLPDTAPDEPTLPDDPELDEPTLDDTRDPPIGESAPPPAPLEAPRPAPPANRLAPAARPKPPSRPRVAPPPPGPLKMLPTETDEHDLEAEVEEADAPEPLAALAPAEGATRAPRRGLSRRLALIGVAAAATLAVAGGAAWLVGYLSARGSKPPVLITTPEPEPRIRVTAAPVEDAGSEADLLDAGR